MEQKDNNFNNLIIQLHIAEYNALTMRNTYLITLQFSLLPVLIISLALAAQLCDSNFDDALLIWGSGLFAQIIGLLWYFCGLEQFRNICYIEHILRNCITKVIKEKEFWKYEKYLSEMRPKKRPVWFEYIIPMLALIIIIILTKIRYPLSRGDIYGLLLNLGIVGLLVWQTICLVRTRHKFFMNNTENS